ncbi:MAG: glycosyltransferase family 4 protein [Bdellovibrionales bacterium]
MRICFIVSRYYPQGAGSGRSVRVLAEGVAKAGHDAVVICLNDGGEKQAVLNGVRIYRLPIRNLYGLADKVKNPLMRLRWHIKDLCNRAAMRDVAKILEAERPDIVNTNVIAGFSTGIFEMIKARGIPLVHTLRDYYLLCPQSGMFRKGQNCQRICAACKPFAAIRKRHARYVDLFLANSDFIAGRHKDLGAFPARQPVITQWNMNEDDWIAPPRPALSDAPVRLGFIGRINPLKGIEVLLKAVQNMKPEWQLKIAGGADPAYLNALKKRYPDPRIDFIGFQNPDDFYKTIDVLICPSLYDDPLPRVIYEAYRHALPVIAADSGGVAEIVDHGKTGLLYPADDETALADAMTAMIAAPEIYVGMSNHAAIKAQGFTQTARTQDYLHILQAQLGIISMTRAAE